MPQFPSQEVASGIWTLKKQKRAAQGLNWPPLNGPADDYFEYVSMLLPGNGTNGAQNNTFLDSSTNNFTITRNGNATQGSFSPFGSNWSNSFNGNGDWLTTNLDATTGQYLAFGSTQDFTIELFFNQVGDSVPSPDASNARNTSLISTTQQDQNFPLTGWDLGINPSSTSIGFSNNNNENSGTGFGASIAVTRNIWHHVAVVRSSGTMTLYLDGAAVATSSAFNNRAITVAASAFLRIGTFRFRGYYNDFNGYISNVRIVKGTAVYSGTTYTVPTAPLTAISGTVLLACQDNRFRDNSSSAYTLSTNGTPSVQRFSPFNPTTPYAAGTIGGSGYFDGSGDYLSAADNAALDFGTGDFTVEGWFYFNSLSNAPMLWHKLASNSGWFLEVASNAIYFGYGNAVSSQYWTLSTTLVTGTWYHLAATRVGSTLSIYINGTKNSTTLSGANSSYDNSASFVVSSFQPNGSTLDLNGYVSNFRVVKGTEVYTANFTPPTAPVTAIANTSLLLNFTNGGIIDNAMMNDLETVGNAQISTSVSKFGGGSMSFVRSPSSYLVANNSTRLLSLGTGDWTIEAWVYMNTLPAGNGYPNSYWIVGGGPSNNDIGFDIAIGSTNLQVGLTTFLSLNINAAHGMAATTWYHVAVVRSGATLYAFINGNQLATANVSGVTVDPCLTGLAISAAEPTGATSGNFNGYIDDLRITKYARYTANFTPPSKAFPTY